MASTRRPRPGLTRIERWVVGTITGLLAAPAIPALAHFQAKGKKAEARGNLGADVDVWISSSLHGSSGTDTAAFVNGNDVMICGEPDEIIGA